MTKESFKQAERLLKQALETLGEHAILYSGLAQIHFWAHEGRFESREEALRSASDFTRRVLALEG